MLFHHVSLPHSPSIEGVHLFSDAPKTIHGWIPHLFINAWWHLHVTWLKSLFFLMAKSPYFHGWCNTPHPPMGHPVTVRLLVTLSHRWPWRAEIDVACWMRSEPMAIRICNMRILTSSSSFCLKNNVNNKKHLWCVFSCMYIYIYVALGWLLLMLCCWSRRRFALGCFPLALVQRLKLECQSINLVMLCLTFRQTNLAMESTSSINKWFSHLNVHS